MPRKSIKPAAKPANQAQPPRSTSRESAEWTEHEHVAPPLAHHAQKLIDEAGSPGLARQALDAAAKHAPIGDSRQDEFARRLGFRSYLDLFEASTLVRTAAGKNWRIGGVPGGWIVWNEIDLAASEVFVTKVAALTQVPEHDMT